MNLRELAEIALACRERQRACLGTRSGEDLKYVKLAEARLDLAIDEVLKPSRPTQPGLFDATEPLDPRD